MSSLLQTTRRPGHLPTVPITSASPDERHSSSLSAASCSPPAGLQGRPPGSENHGRESAAGSSRPVKQLSSYHSEDPRPKIKLARYLAIPFGRVFDLSRKEPQVTKFH